jgi:RimJ/RimL family protein N-acetyltransferase
MIQTPLHTRRLKIRPLELSDSEFIFQLVNSRGWLEFIGDRDVRSMDDASAYISKILETPNFYYSVIQKLDSNESVGILSFLYREDFDSPDFGFALLPKYYKKGYAKEASIAYINHLIHEMLLPEVLGICKEDNESSIKLLKSLGFKYSHKHEGNGETLTVYSIKN